MNYTFKQLQDKILGWLDYSDDQGPMRERVKEALNDALVTRVADARWPFMLVEPPSTVTVSPGTQVYALDGTLDRLLYVKDQASGEPLHEVPRQEYYENTQEDDFVLRGQNLKLLVNPTRSRVLEYQFYKLPTLLSGDADEPDIPFPHSLILVYDSLLTLRAYTTEADNIREWEKMQERMQNNLIQTFLIEGQTLGAHSTYIQSDPEDWQ